MVNFNELPPDRYGYDNALVMIDRLTKALWTVPCTRSATARDAATMYYHSLYRVYGLPKVSWILGIE
jgi:hypothetical protein